MNLPLLILALIAVESGGVADAVGDDGKAVGILQIHPKYVKDCNRISGMLDRFKQSDRLDPAASFSMCGIYLTYWSRRYKLKTGQKATAEIMARIHNGGPNGYKRDSTVPYWNKVKIEMDRIRAGR